MTLSKVLIVFELQNLFYFARKKNLLETQTGIIRTLNPNKNTSTHEYFYRPYYQFLMDIIMKVK